MSIEINVDLHDIWVPSWATDGDGNCIICGIKMGERDHAFNDCMLEVVDRIKRLEEKVYGRT